MNDDYLKKELIINNSPIPFIRAGVGNLLLIFLLICSFDEFFSSLIGIIVMTVIILYLMHMYTVVISKIIFCKNTIIFVTSFLTINLDLEKIEKIKIIGVPSNQYISLKIKRTGKIIPFYFYIAAVKTNFGYYNTTIENILSEYGIEYYKNFDLRRVIKKIFKKIQNRKNRDGSR